MVTGKPLLLTFCAVVKLSTRFRRGTRELGLEVEQPGGMTRVLAKLRKARQLRSVLQVMRAGRAVRRS
jgi:hypothetical protein